jgi:hypothetical protein
MRANDNDAGPDCGRAVENHFLGLTDSHLGRRREPSRRQASRSIGDQPDASPSDCLLEAQDVLSGAWSFREGQCDRQAILFRDHVQDVHVCRLRRKLTNHGIRNDSYRRLIESDENLGHQ